MPSPKHGSISRLLKKCFPSPSFLVVRVDFRLSRCFRFFFFLCFFSACCVVRGHAPFLPQVISSVGCLGRLCPSGGSRVRSRVVVVVGVRTLQHKINCCAALGAGWMSNQPACRWTHAHTNGPTAVSSRSGTITAVTGVMFVGRKKRCDGIVVGSGEVSNIFDFHLWCLFFFWIKKNETRWSPKKINFSCVPKILPYGLTFATKIEKMNKTDFLLFSTPSRPANLLCESIEASWSQMTTEAEERYA